MSAAQQVGALGVPTGIPVKGYDGPEAEKMRQERVVGDFAGRDPELIAAYETAKREVASATARLADLRLRVSAAVGPGAIHDVDAHIERKFADERSKAGANVGKSLQVGHVPDYAYPEADQAKIREARRAELSKSAPTKK